jgi:hypothetical protein
MKHFNYAFLLVLLSGCQAIPILPEANQVIASPNPVPQGCRYKGQVFGHQGNAFSGGFTSNRNLEVGAMNDLKNEALKLHANYVQIITSRAGITGSYSTDGDGYGAGRSQQTNITNVGNAYSCPPRLIGLEK